MADAAGSVSAAQAEFWNSQAARGWADQHQRMDRVLVPLLEALMTTAAPQPGEHVLDIGCGSGTTVLELAARVGPSGHVTGADIAAPSVAHAQRRIAAAGLGQADVIVADASTYAFPKASFDLVCSRLGVMFFADPLAAFRNIRRAIKPTGRAAFVVIRAPGENLWPNGPTGAVRHLLPPLPAPDPEEPGLPKRRAPALPGPAPAAAAGGGAPLRSDRLPRGFRWRRGSRQRRRARSA